MIPNIPETRKALDMLQLLHHRNKNQHRQAHWWKWLSMLKRCLQKLIDELQCTATKPSDTRILYMRNHLLPRCYVAFTQVVRDNQFSALGLVLVAALARVWKLIGGDGEGAVELVEVCAGDDRQRRGGATSRCTEDVGEIVERKPSSNDVAPDSAKGDTTALQRDMARPVRDASAGENGPQLTSGPKAIKRRKAKHGKVKKGSSVINDLFSGLV